MTLSQMALSQVTIYLCDGEGECAYTAYAPHFDIFAFRKPFSKHDYLDVIPVWSFRLNFLGEMTQLNF